MSNDLVTLRTEVKQRLMGIQPLQNIDILMEDRLDLLTEIQKALASVRGATICVSTGDVIGKDHNIFPPMGDVKLVVEVAENPVLNRSEAGGKIPAIEMAAIVAKALHHFQWAEGSVLVFDRMRSEVEGKTVVLYTVVFNTSVLLDAALG